MDVPSRDPAQQARYTLKKFLWSALYKVSPWLLFVPLGLYLYGLPFVHERLGHLIPEEYRLTIAEALILSVLLVLLDRALRIEQVLRAQAARMRKFWFYPSREDAYGRICALIQEHSGRVKAVDLLQFSGDTAAPILREVARSCPGARTRLFLVSQEVADRYDEPDFHWTRVKNTKGVLRVLREDFPHFQVEVWSYSAPSLAGVIIDEWLVSAGWYHILPRKNDPSTLSVRGHASPAVVAVDDESKPLLFMVRGQLEAIERTATLEFKLPD